MEIQSIDDLRNSIQAIIVKDYGDFKRKTVTYLNRYSENQTLSDNQKSHMSFMKWYIQFHPNLQLTETKQWTLDQIEKFKTQ
jgi:hypothetical protein